MSEITLSRQKNAKIPWLCVVTAEKTIIKVKLLSVTKVCTLFITR